MQIRYQCTYVFNKSRVSLIFSPPNIQVSTNTSQLTFHFIIHFGFEQTVAHILQYHESKNNHIYIIYTCNRHQEDVFKSQGLL